jgi:hypothetical protein
MKNQIANDFEKWLRERHLEGCIQCQKDGKARLMDSYALANVLFREFYETKMER